MRLLELSRPEMQYLTSAAFLPAKLLYEIGRWNDSNKTMNSIEIRDETAEELRSLLTEHLAKVGFDETYGVNSEGALLESLIDRFG